LDFDDPKENSTQEYFYVHEKGFDIFLDGKFITSKNTNLHKNNVHFSPSNMGGEK